MRQPTIDDQSAISVFIVDDHAGYRSVASAVVTAAQRFALAGSASSTAEALDELEKLGSSPDLVLMDVNLADESGVDATRTLLARHPSAKIVLVSTLRSDELPPGSTTCGASGYLPKLRLSAATLADLWAGAYDWAP